MPGPCLCDALRALARARCRQWLETLRPARDALALAIHLYMPMIALCGDCRVRLMGKGFRLQDLSQVIWRRLSLQTEAHFLRKRCF